MANQQKLKQYHLLLGLARVQQTRVQLAVAKEALVRQQTTRDACKARRAAARKAVKEALEAADKAIQEVENAYKVWMGK